MSFARLLAFIVWVGSLAASLGCTTVMKPVRPSAPVDADGPPLSGLRFDGEETRIREPGVPVSTSRAWQREVANYTATTLNRALSTQDAAPAAATTASFDLAEPPPFSFGPKKRMTITLTSTLPDGNVVRSKPVTGDLDTFGEVALVGGLGVGGTLVDIAAIAAVLYFITTPSIETAGVLLFGSLALGLLLNVAQGAAEQVVVLSQETRWSDLYAKALREHATDVRNGVGRGPPPEMLATPPGTVAPTPAVTDPSDALGPPRLNDPWPPPTPLPALPR
jgi:hypothetical protein